MNAFVTTSSPGPTPGALTAPVDPDAEAALDALAASQPGLAHAFREGWSTPVGAWAAGQLQAPSDAAFEPAFREALVDELAERSDLGGVGAEALVARVEALGAVLTPHHVCPTPGATFGAIDRMATLGMARRASGGEAGGPLLLLAWSGVPMSNSASSGALCFAESAFEALLEPGPELKRQRQAAKDRARDGVVEQRITLVSSAQRDALLFGCPQPTRLAEVHGAATEALRRVMPAPEAGEDYPRWAARMYEGLQRQVLGYPDLWVVDLNRVAVRYLCTVLEEPEHPVSRLLAASHGEPHGEPHTEPRPGFPDMSWFYGRRPGKREKVLTLDAAPEDLREGLVNGTWCPGLVPVFGALRLLSRVRLLGGYRQVGYLEAIAAAWLESGVVAEDRGVPGHMLTGRLSHEGRPVYPLDLATGATPPSVLPTASTPMAQLWAPLLPRVRENAS